MKPRERLRPASDRSASGAATGRESPLSASGLRAVAREREAELQQMLTDLAQSVDRLGSNSHFCNLLAGRLRLLSYGAWNQLLILAQCRSATWVQGPRQWERIGRSVKPGARPINILAPSRPGRPWPFKVIDVYDVRQTDGPDIPDPEMNYRGGAHCLPRVESAAALLGIRLTEVEQLGGTPGAVALGQARGGEVLVRKGLEPAERVLVLVHEYAHELLHLAGKQCDHRGRPPGSHAIRETEADATAFLVLSTLGIAYNSPSYIVWQGGDGRILLRSFKRILAAARAIKAAIDGERPQVDLPRLTAQAPSAPCSKRVRPRKAVRAAMSRRNHWAAKPTPRRTTR